MKIKKIFTFLILSIILFSNSIVIGADTASLNIYCPSVILIDSTTGKVLYEKNANEKMYPASVTKIMTAILVIENCNLTDIVKASYSALESVPYDYSIIDIKLDEELTIEQLLYATMVPSACDASAVLAEHVSGSIENFATLMNQKATELGCTNTHFTNPGGIYDDNHYTTANDLAKISQYAMKNSIFRTIVLTKTYVIPNTNKSESRELNNTNLLLEPDDSSSPDNYYYRFATGIKTGYTDEGGYTLAASAKQENLEVISVVLGAGSTADYLSERYLDTKNLFTFAFNTYTQRSLVKKGDVLKQVEIKNATKKTKDLNLIVEDNITVLIEKINLNSEVDTVMKLKDDLQAPIIQGELVGTLTYTVEGLTYTTNLTAGNDVQKFNNLIIIIPAILAFIIIVLFGIRFYNLNFRKKNRYNNKKVIHVTNVK